MGLCLIKGYRGTGKTTIMSRTAIETEFPNIYANVHMLDLNSKFFFLHSYDIFNLKKNSLIFIDEAYKWLDCRLSQTRITIFLSHISMESRKTNQDWYIACQYDDYIDFRFTNDADLVIECENIKLGKYPNGMEKNDYIYRFKWKDKRIKNKSFKLSCKEAELIYPHFDTNECVEEFGKIKYKLGVLKDNPKLLAKEIKQVSRKIDKYTPTRFTKSDITMILLENGYSEDYSKYVFPQLKRLRNPNWNKIKKKK